MSQNSFLFHPVCPREIITTTTSMAKISSSGSDDIPMRIVISTIDSTTDILSLLINLSFELGTFPKHLKIAKVRPVRKSNDSNDVTNFRPISLISSFSKVFEKIVHDKLTSY